MINLLRDINQDNDFTTDQLTDIMHYFEVEKFRKKSTILKYGEEEDKFYIVKNGLVIKSANDKLGNITVGNIFDLGSWLNINLLNFENINAAFDFIAVEDTLLLSIPKKQLKSLLEKYPMLYKYFSRKLQNANYKFELRILNKILFEADTQYILFINTYPELVKRLPQHYVASYLGIKPETLSRTRKSIKSRNLDNPFDQLK